MRSQKIWLERYRILYTWKVLEGRVPNCGISASNCDRKGRLCNIPNINKHAKKSVQNFREDSFQVNAPQIFNCIPAEIQNMTWCHIDDFKFKLKEFLEHYSRWTKSAEPNSYSFKYDDCKSFKLSGGPDQKLWKINLQAHVLLWRSL